MNKDNYLQPPTEPETKPDFETSSTPTEPQSAALEPAAAPETQPIVTPDAQPTVEPNTLHGNGQPMQLKKSHKTAVLVVLGIVVVLAVAGAAYYVGQRSKTAVTNPTQAVSKAAPVTTQKTTTASFVDKYFEKAVAVTPAPTIFKKTNTQNCYDDNNNTTACKYNVNQIGTTHDGRPILVIDNGQQNMFFESYIVLQTGTNSYSLLINYDGYNQNSAAQGKEISRQLDPSTTVDDTTRLSDLRFDPTLSFKGETFKSSFDSGHPLLSGLASLRGATFGPFDVSKAHKVGTNGPQTIYQVTAAEGINYKINEIYATVNQVFAQSYQLKSALNDGKTPPAIKWTDDATNKATFSSRPPGCGSYDGYLVAKNITDADLTLAGTSPGGQKLYNLATTNALFKQLYTDDYSAGVNLEDAKLKNLTADQFQAQHGFFIAKNGLGENVVYGNNTFIVGGGCGKPVVYLYPTHTQTVSVSVGADVQVSEPQYGARGWQNVTAHPDGSLIYQGHTYPNLYWEGQGHGEYPVIDSGTVVASKDAVATIQRQLKEQGLNAQETSDFLTYWQPRLPSSPYIRLTWFDTKQMNELAPLAITPRPATMIRVFLDFQGMNTPVTIPGQHFNAPKRVGFTAVEWGGLNRNSGLSQ